MLFCVLIQGMPGAPGGPRGREMIFPPGSVEATHPLMMKRRKHTKLDVQPVEGWRLVMALKSGLLMESTWALDVLNVLLYDDNAFTYFGLGNMPGLMEAVLEHWRASLIGLFGVTEDLEVPAEAPEVESRTRKRARCDEEDQARKWYHTKSETAAIKIEAGSEKELELGIAKPFDAKDKHNVLSGNDFSKRPRFSEEEVEFVERDEELFVTDEDRAWDYAPRSEDAFPASELWARGGGLSTSHVMPAFSPDMAGLVPFVRLLKDMASPAGGDRAKSRPSPSKRGKKGAAKEEKAKAASSEAPSKEIKSEAAEEVEGEGGGDSKEDIPAQPEDIVDKIRRLTGIVLRDPEAARRRWSEESLEDECYMRDEPSLHLVSESQDSLGRRAVAVSTILRNLSFVPGNEFEFSRNTTFLTIAGRLLLFCHWYPKRAPKQRNYDRGAKDSSGEDAAGLNAAESSAEAAESCTSLLNGEAEWWWDFLHVIRENVMVVLANISGALELSPFEEAVVRPILHGLLEWSVSSSSYAQDPFPYVGAHSTLSPQRLAIETLTKLCLHESNVDLILTTPPFGRIVKLTRLLARKLYRYEDQVLREFSINMLYYLSAADTGVARTIAVADQTVGLLLGFIEQAEQNALVVAQQHGVNALRDNPDSMGTSLDMLRRAASTLFNLSRHADNVPLFVTHEQRLLSLVMSQILDQGVASILSNVLFNIAATAGDKEAKDPNATSTKKRRKSSTSVPV